MGNRRTSHLASQVAPQDLCFSFPTHSPGQQPPAPRLCPALLERTQQYKSAQALHFSLLTPTKLQALLNPQKIMTQQAKHTLEITLGYNCLHGGEWPDNQNATCPRLLHQYALHNSNNWKCWFLYSWPYPMSLLQFLTKGDTFSISLWLGSFIQVSIALSKSGACAFLHRCVLGKYVLHGES